MNDFKLIPKDALSGFNLGISVSESPDLARLGLIETHFRLALAEITRCVVVSGGHLSYGGHLKPDGYTAFMLQELERYSRRDRPLHIYLSWSEHRKLSLNKLAEEKSRLGLYATITYLDPEGVEIDLDKDRGEEPEIDMDIETTGKSLNGLRRYMAENTAGRVFLGGKSVNYQGKIPGLLEEAILAVEHKQPVYLAGGFGGLTLEIAKTLGVEIGDWPPTFEGSPKYDARTTSGFKYLNRVAVKTKHSSLQNGLSVEENKQLASSHRPSEIASLISLGMGRRFLDNE